MRIVRVAYRNLWAGGNDFSAEHIVECFPCLRGQYRFEISSDPQLVLYSVYGYYHSKVNESAIRVLYSGEAGDTYALGGKLPSELVPGAMRYRWGDFEYAYDPDFFDFGITASATTKPTNHYYMPAGFLHLNMYHNGVATLTEMRAPNTREYFGNFIYSNPCQYRVEFLKEFSKYRRVECCGQVEHNNNEIQECGAYHREGYLGKQRFQNRCKFSIVFENCHYPGYNTEKITDALLARSVPIYSGDPHISDVFNPAAIINVDRFANWEAAIEFIKMVDQNDELYQSFLDAPAFVGNVVPERFKEETFLRFWREILQRIT